MRFANFVTVLAVKWQTLADPSVFSQKCATVIWSFLTKTNTWRRENKASWRKSKWRTNSLWDYVRSMSTRMSCWKRSWRPIWKSPPLCRSKSTSWKVCLASRRRSIWVLPMSRTGLGLTIKSCRLIADYCQPKMRTWRDRLEKGIVSLACCRQNSIPT